MSGTLKDNEIETYGQNLIKASKIERIRDKFAKGLIIAQNYKCLVTSKKPA